MRQFLFLLILSALVQVPVFGQGEAISLGKEKTFRLSIGLGLSLSTTTKQLKSHLQKNGFGVDVNAPGIYGFGGLDQEYPESNSSPFIAELALERQFDKQKWLGISIGYGQFSKVIGNGYSEYVTMKHTSWFLSPQYTIYVPESNFGFFGGPTLNFHTLKLEWDNQFEKKKHPVKIGALIGLRVNTSGRWEWVIAYNWSPKLKFDAINAASLPSAEIGFSSLKMVFSYRFSL